MIYFVRHVDTGLIKIGYTANVSGRLRDIANTYGAITLLGLYGGDWADERDLHLKFNAFNIRDVLNGREWFSADVTLMGYIEEYCYATLQTLYEPGKKRIVRYTGEARFESLFPVALARKEERDGKRYTQRQIALATGISQALMSRIFRGRIEGLNLATARKVCLWLDCDYKDIIRIVR